MVSSNLATLDPDLLQFLASDAFGALYGLEEIAGDSGHALASSLARAMAGIPREHVDAKLKDPVFRSLHGEDPPDSTDRRARLWILSENTGRYICSERLRLLSHSGSSRPDPYDHEALADIDLSPDYLVPLDQFQIDGIALLRNG